MAAVILVLVVDSLEWVHRAALAEFVMCALCVTTNTKEVLVHDVAPRCNVQTFSKNVS